MTDSPSLQTPTILCNMITKRDVTGLKGYLNTVDAFIDKGLLIHNALFSLLVVITTYTFIIK